MRHLILWAMAATVLSSACQFQSATQEPTGLRQTPGPTSEASQWKRFSSRNHGFEFRYPESCKLSESNDSLNVGSRIELAILESEGMGLDDYVSRFVDKRTRDADWTVELVKSGALRGQESMTIDYRFGGQKRFGTATLTVREAKVYVWGLTAGVFTCDEHDVYDSILASFRFID